MGRRKFISPATADVRAALRKRFEAPAYAFFEEVGNATGWAKNRSADALAMSLWPSRGLDLSGIEIKASRQDWLSELKNPEKADDIAKFCDFWWLAIADEKIVQPGELPMAWGLLVLEGERLVCKAEPQRLSPEAMGRSFVAALLRRASEVQVELGKEAERRGFERGVKEGPGENAGRLKRVEDENTRLLKGIEEFEQKSGITFHTYNAGDIGEAVEKLMRAKWEDADPVAELDRAATHLEHAMKRCRQTANKFRAAVKKMPKETEAAE